MALVQSKQINKHIAGDMYISGFTFAAGATATVTAALTTAAATAGYGGVAVPVQDAVISATTPTEGFIVTGNNRVEVWTGANGGKLSDADGNEVYGRLTSAAGVYTLSLYVAPGGVETAYTLAANTTLDFGAIYYYSFEHLPFDFATGTPMRYIGDDPAASAKRTKMELVSVTAMNTLAALSNAYVAGQFVLFVNGQAMNILDGSFTAAGTAVTWVPATAGYNLATTDSVIAFYTY